MIRRFLDESRLIRHYLWKYKGFVAAGLFALIVVDTLEIIPPLLLKETVDLVILPESAGLFAKLAVFSLIYLGVVLVQAVCRYFWRMTLVRTSMLSGRDIRASFARHLVDLSPSFYDRRRIGDLMSLATNDTEAIRMAIGAGVIVLADAVFYLVTITAAMLWLSPKLTLIAFLPLPFIPFIVYWFERQIHARFGAVQESFAQVAALAQENIMGIRLVRAFANEDAQLGRFARAGRDYAAKSLRLARVQSAFDPSLDFIMSLGLVCLLAFGGPLVIGDVVTIGTFVAFQRYIQKMIWPMAAIGVTVTIYQRAVASGKRVAEVMAERTDVPEDATPSLPTRWVSGGRAKGRVEWRRLNFAFPAGPRESGGGRPVLKDVSITVEPGQRVALLGRIGSGKTALLSTLPRLYPVADGQVFLDGVDVNRWPLAELRAQIGFVSQDVFLFSDSVAENIALGLAGLDDPTGRLAWAERFARLAAVDGDIARLPNGYQTMLGERGVNLSGGQKQRITLARAWARRPPVLVLDDALSAVDVETESKILGSLRAGDGAGAMAQIVAAHRISTIQDADQIYVLDGGEVVQAGRHAALLRERAGLYRRFYDQQRLAAELESYTEQLASQSGTSGNPGEAPLER
ncbi:MAG: ABC transporter ATP-binding protein [Bacteriovoracia bacterium]